MKRTRMVRTKFKASKRGRTRRVTQTALNQMCRRIVVDLRDHHTCQRCGKTSPIEWAHVKSRNNRSLIAVPWNSLALCGPKINPASCHGWWHTNITAAMAWWREKFPDRDRLLRVWEHGRGKPRNMQLEKLWLERQLQLMEERSERQDRRPGAPDAAQDQCPDLRSNGERDPSQDHPDPADL